jgi:hypothetical protein
VNCRCRRDESPHRLAGRQRPYHGAGAAAPAVAQTPVVADTAPGVSTGTLVTTNGSVTTIMAAGEARLGFALLKRGGPGDHHAAHADFAAATTLANSIARVPGAPPRVHTDSAQLVTQRAPHLAQ